MALEFLVEIPNKNTTGHMGAGNLPDWVLLFFSGQGVDDCYLPIDTGEAEHLLNVAEIILGTSKGKKAIPGFFGTLLQTGCYFPP